jgi:hypothetical protein
VFLDNNQTSTAQKKAEYNVERSNMPEAAEAGNKKTIDERFKLF